MSLRIAALTTAAVLAVATLAAGCGSDTSASASEYDAVCVDPTTQQRLDDDVCDDDDHDGYLLVFYPLGHAIPPVGGHATGYTTSVPKGSTWHTGSPVRGSTARPPVRPGSNPRPTARSSVRSGSNPGARPAPRPAPPKRRP